MGPVTTLHRPADRSSPRERAGLEINDMASTIIPNAKAAHPVPKNPLGVRRSARAILDDCCQSRRGQWMTIKSRPSAMKKRPNAMGPMSDGSWRTSYINL